MIEIVQLGKDYGRFTAVHDLTLTVQPGEVLGLVGPNGAGKTTTFRCLAGVIPPSRGTVKIRGHSLALAPLEAKRQLAYFPDEPRLFDYLTVKQHLAFTARIYGVEGHERLGKELLEELELANKLNELPGALSRGMKQKLAIACGFLHDPKVMFFDEPLTGLDPGGIRKMKDSILRRARDGATILISSHLLHLVEEICSHLLILKEGKAVAAGPIEEVRRRFAQEAPGATLEDIFFKATGTGE